MTNKKGFTLIELLAVIVIMALLLAVAVPGVITISNKIKKNMYCTKIGLLENNAILWGQDNMNLLRTSATDYTGVSFNLLDSSVLTIQRLIDDGYVKKDDTVSGNVLDPRDNTTSLNSLRVKVYLKNQRVYAKIAETAVINTCS